MIIQTYRKDEGDFCIKFTHDETDSLRYFKQDEENKILTELAEAGNEISEEVEESYPDSLPDLIETEPTDEEEHEVTECSERPSCVAEQAEQRSLFGPEGFEGQLDIKRSYVRNKTNKAKQTLEDLD